MAGRVAPSAQFCCVVALWAVCILVGTELIFLRDLFGSRMNTVFKFQYHAWLLFGVASAAGLGLIWRQPVVGAGLAGRLAGGRGAGADPRAWSIRSARPGRSRTGSGATRR